MTQIQKAFSVGNSTVATLPSAWGIAPGVKLRSLPKRKNILSYEVIESSPKLPTPRSRSQEKHHYLKQVSGAIDSTTSTSKVMTILQHYKDNPYGRI